MGTVSQQDAPLTTPGTKGYKGLPLEGLLARWYAKTTGRNIDSYHKLAEMVHAQVPAGGSVLEVAQALGISPFVWLSSATAA